jgi:hypothetical protein
MRSTMFVRLVSGCFPMLRKSTGLFLIFAATCSAAQAGPAPEIDPGSISGALAMLASGFYLFTGSRRRKEK